MKKHFMYKLIIFVSFTLLLSACGTGGENTSEKDQGSDGDKKALRVVTDAAFAPFEYMDKGK